MADNLVGKKLGDYNLLRKLATGGMAHIYLGEDAKLGRRAAVKVLTSEMRNNDTLMLERFEREARAIAQLEHDSIIPIYQFGEYEDMYFLAMRYVEGRDLADEIHALRAEGKLIEIPRMLYILNEVAAALDYAHSRGIIHRDVKPSNVLIGLNDKVYLSDFGLVLWRSVDKTMGTAFGTPRYISPEQATDSQSVTGQSDIYSLAVMVYEMVTGALLFDAENPIEVALAHVTQTPLPPRTHNAAIPVAVQNEILRALSKDPNQRHPTAMEFVDALRVAYDAESFGTGTQMVSPDSLPSLPSSDPAILNAWTRSKTEEALETPPVKPLPPKTNPPIQQINPTKPPLKPERPRPSFLRRLLLLPIRLVAILLVAVVAVFAVGTVALGPDGANDMVQRGLALLGVTTPTVTAPLVITADQTEEPTVTTAPTLTSTTRPTNTFTPTATNTLRPTNTVTATLPTATSTTRPTNTFTPTVATATNTLRPTNTFTPTVPTATNTARPTNTFTPTVPTATNTARPTNTFTPTVPTATNTVRPTNTTIPTLTNTVVPSTTAVPVTPSGVTALVLLRYNETTLIVLNNSNETILLQGVSLIGQPSDPEDAFLYDSDAQALTPGKCTVMTRGGTPAQIPPEWACEEAFRITVTKTTLFWLANAAEDTNFTVRIGEADIATCPTVGRAVRLTANECRVDWTAIGSG